MAVQVILVLMHSDYILMTGKESLGKFFADFKNLLRCHLLIFVKTDDVVGIHSSRVFIPESLFSEPGLINFIVVDGLAGIRSSNFDISFFYLFITKDIFKNIPHCSVAFC